MQLGVEVPAQSSDVMHWTHWERAGSQWLALAGHWESIVQPATQTWFMQRGVEPRPQLLLEVHWTHTPCEQTGVAVGHWALFVHGGPIASAAAATSADMPESSPDASLVLVDASPPELEPPPPPSRIAPLGTGHMEAQAAHWFIVNVEVQLAGTVQTPASPLTGHAQS
jgi:hypothetical protein